MASEGPNSPGTMADVDNGGDGTWSNVDNAKTSNDSYALANIGNVEDTHYLKATNFGFSIPEGVTIDGIVVEVEKWNNPTGPRNCVDQIVSIVKADDSVGAENKADTVTNYPISDPNTYVSYGANNNLWSEAWEYSDINNSNFGMVITSEDSGGPFGNARPSVDHIRITVYYTSAVITDMIAITKGTNSFLNDIILITFGCSLTTIAF